MEVKILVRNRDEQDKVNKVIKRILQSPDYEDMDEYAWRYALCTSAKIIIDKNIPPTTLEEFELACECGQQTQSECEINCIRYQSSNENGEEWENGRE